MGFPDVQEALTQSNKRKFLIIACYIIGLVSWIYLLTIATEPKWYFNELYWKHV